MRQYVRGEIQLADIGETSSPGTVDYWPNLCCTFTVHLMLYCTLLYIVLETKLLKLLGTTGFESPFSHQTSMT